MTPSRDPRKRRWCRDCTDNLDPCPVPCVGCERECSGKTIGFDEVRRQRPELTVKHLRAMCA